MLEPPEIISLGGERLFTSLHEDREALRSCCEFTPPSLHIVLEFVWIRELPTKSLFGVWQVFRWGEESLKIKHGVLITYSILLSLKENLYDTVIVPYRIGKKI